MQYTYWIKLLAKENAPNPYGRVTAKRMSISGPVSGTLVGIAIPTEPKCPNCGGHEL